MLTLKRKQFNEYFFNMRETSNLIWGFTEAHFPIEALSRLLSPYAMVELKQVHADTLRLSSQITPGMSDTPGTEGDGIILDQRQTVAIIKTADCTPLFFWDKEGAVGGVVHIGWKGLLKGIERKLLEVLREKFPAVDLGRLNFYLGPSIETKCYEVGPDLYEAFSIKTYRDEIFYPFSPRAAGMPGTPRNPETIGTTGTTGDKNSPDGNQSKNRPGMGEAGTRKYRMDVKKGIRLSLREGGIRNRQIWESGLCTFCEVGRLPSYRRSPETDDRVYNFLVLK